MALVIYVGLPGGVQRRTVVLASQVQMVVFKEGPVQYASLLSLLIEVLDGPRRASSDRREPYIRLRIRHMYSILHFQLVLAMRLLCHRGHRRE